MRTLRILMIVTATMLMAFFVWNLTLSGTYKAETSLQIDVASGKIREHIVDLEAWPAWSTFLRRDTALTLQYSTPPKGERAWVSWKNSNQTGGRLEIMKDDSLRLEFLITLDGFKGAVMFIEIEPSEESSLVKWSVEGELPFYARFMKGQFEKTVRTDFEKSLEQLSTLLVNGSLPNTADLQREDVLSETDETAAQIVDVADSISAHIPALAINEGQWESGTFYYIQIESTIHEISWERLTDAFETVKEYVGDAAFKEPMFVKYDVYDEKHDYVMLYVGMVVDVDLPKRSRDVQSETVRRGAFIERIQMEDDRVLHFGDDSLDEYMNDHGYQMHGRVFERFELNDNAQITKRFVRYPVISASEAITSL